MIWGTYTFYLKNKYYKFDKKIKKQHCIDIPQILFLGGYRGIKEIPEHQNT